MVAHVSILPQDILDTLFAHLDAPTPLETFRFLRLPHPRTGVPSLFLPYMSSDTKESRLAEVQVISPTNARSWFVSDNRVVEDGDLLVMTPVDPAFLLISLLRSIHSTDGSHGTYRPLDDIFELAVEHLSKYPLSEPTAKDAATQFSADDVSHFLSLGCARNAAKRVCEMKQITPEITVYRYSHDQVLETLKAKVTRLVTPEVFEGSRTLIRSLAKDGLMEDGKEELLSAGRLRAACDLLSQYLPPDVFESLLASYDFANLSKHLQLLADEAAENAAIQMEKSKPKTKSKAKEGENEKKRKNAKASHGVEQLKKVNTKGMAKISSFFKSKETS